MHSKNLVRMGTCMNTGLILVLLLIVTRVHSGVEKSFMDENVFPVRKPGLVHMYNLCKPHTNINHLQTEALYGSSI